MQLSSSSPMTHLNRLLRQDSQGDPPPLTAESESVESLLFILLKDASLLCERLGNSCKGLGAIAIGAVRGSVLRLDMAEIIKRIAPRTASCVLAEVGFAVSLSGPA